VSLPGQRLLEADLAGPLEGRVRLGDHRGEPEGDLPPPSLPHDAVGQVGDPLEVFVPLAGQADHEVELDGLPPAVEDAPRRIEQVGIGVALVDDVAQPLRACLGGDRETRLADPADLLDEPRAEGLHAKRREPHGDPPLAVSVHQLPEQRLDARVVARAERQQRDLVISRGPEGLLGHREQCRGVPLPHGPPHHSRLTETASPRAAPGDLEGDAVVDRVHERNNGPQREEPPVEIGDDALAHAAPLPLQGRHKEPLQPCEALEDPGAPKALFPGRQHHGGDLRDHLLALADDEGIEKGSHGKRVERAGSPGNHDGIPVAPVPRAQGDSPEVEHGQDVRVGQLVLQREPDKVESRERRARLEGREPQPAGAQPGLHVRPWGVDALGTDVRVGVQDGVEDLEPQVGHPHLVGVGKGQGDAQAASGAVPARRVGLAADVAARFLDESQEGLEQMMNRSLTGHVYLSRDCAPADSSSPDAGQPHPTATSGRQEEQKSGVDLKIIFVPSALPHFRPSDLHGIDSCRGMQGTRRDSPGCPPSPARGTSTDPSRSRGASRGRSAPENALSTDRAERPS